MLLYHNKVEYSRVVEELDVTEDGIFLKDKTPDDYSGAVMRLEVVHRVTMADSAGHVEILKFDNPVPLDKEKKPSTAAVEIDGKPHRPGSSPARVWTTRAAPNLPADVKSKADVVLEVMKSDGESGSRV